MGGRTVLVWGGSDDGGVRPVPHLQVVFPVATCADVVELVQMKGGTQYNIHLLWNLCRCGQTCADEGWNTVKYSSVM